VKNNSNLIFIKVQ